MHPFKRGQWIRWTTEFHTKRGQVVKASGPSIVVRWLDGTEQVFPLVEAYLPPFASQGAQLVVIERPREARRVERDQRRGVTSVAAAAETLGVTPKRVRAMLRNGKLKGTRQDGKWITVNIDRE